MIHWSAPGKLLIAGDWAVLEPGNPGIVAAVNRRVHSAVEENGHDISITIDDFGIRDLPARFDGKHIAFDSITEGDRERLKFIKEAGEVALRFLAENGVAPKPFRIQTWGEELQIKGKKIGFGSSASSTAAVIASLLAFHGYEASKETLFKLATIAHYYAQGKAGSGFDVAASVYGGVFVYKRFDSQWFAAMIGAPQGMKAITQAPWPLLTVEQLGIPDSLRLLVAWTEEPSSTSALIRHMDAFKGVEKASYDALYTQIAQTVNTLIRAWKDGNKGEIFALIKRNRQLLHELTMRSRVPIETKELQQLAELADNCGAAGKLSGAGGGDCGIAICFDEETEHCVQQAWHAAGFHVLDVTIDREGAREE